jgi:hypothetical protein
MLRSRVLAGLDRVRQQGKKLDRLKVSAKVEDAIRTHLSPPQQAELQALMEAWR